MNIDSLKGLLTTHLPDCSVTVEGDGHHFKAIIVGDIFAGKNRLERHRLVYNIVVNHIATGNLHALSLKTHTPAEWAEINK